MTAAAAGVVAEDQAPLAVGLVRGDDDAAAGVAPGHVFRSWPVRREISLTVLPQNRPRGRGIRRPPPSSSIVRSLKPQVNGHIR